MLFAQFVAVLAFLIYFDPTLIFAKTDKVAKVTSISHSLSGDGVKVIIQLSDNMKCHIGKLSGLERLYVDIKDTVFSRHIKKKLLLDNQFIKAIKTGQYKEDTARIVIEFAIGKYSYNVLREKEMKRLVVSISPVRNGEGKAAERKGRTKKRIIVDAGHGGHDTGAIGPKGLYEKDVVLDIARRIKKHIQKSSCCEVILTRDRDIFIPLNERAAIANRHSADFFISVHANASPNKNARGIETYLLNWTDNEEAMNVAARENAISVEKMKKEQDELGIILKSLEMESKRDDSVKLAGHVQNSIITQMKKDYAGIHDLGVKQAMFYVLIGARMPSILVEVSFISNQKEEKLLSDEKYRTNISKGIAAGINEYTASPGLVATVK